MKEELIQELGHEPLSYLASKWLIDRKPHIFNDYNDFIQWKERLGKLILVDSKSIIFVGSACAGFSLNPYKDFDLFDKYSDIDIAIVSTHYFNVSWDALLNFGTRFYTFLEWERSSILDHKKRLIYHGTIAADKILHLLPFGKIWMDAMAQMSKQSPTAGREIKVRIYKDFESLRAYHINNLMEIKNKHCK